MTNASNWMFVDIFTVNQAASLWAGFDPSGISSVDSFNPSEVLAAKQILVSAIVTSELPANSKLNAFASIGDFSTSLVSRSDLEKFAKSKRLFPAFLFDTIAPFEGDGGFRSQQRIVVASAASSSAPKTQLSRGGRPPEYDWNTFHLEIIRLANTPDGLPVTQAELIRAMLEWFRAEFDHEPAESAVKVRISKIYNYLGKAKNLAD